MLITRQYYNKFNLYLSTVLFFSYSSYASGKIDEYRDLINPHTKVVLTCDGGGIRGIIPLTIAAAIEKEAGVRIAEGCDLMEGTSTGGILTLGLNYPDENDPSKPKYQASDLLNIYHQYSKDIFPPLSFRKVYTLNGFLGARYSGNGIQKVAKQYFADGLMSSSITKVGIVANNIDPDVPYVFYSDDPYTDWYMHDVVKATAAAPTYLPVAAIHPLKKTSEGFEVDKLRYFVDGGISSMNNPSTRAYADISDMIYQEVDEELKMETDIQRQVINSYLCKNVRFISLGTGYVETHQSYDSMRNAGVLNWLSPLINLTLGMPSQSNDQQMRTFLPSYRDEKDNMITRYWRLNPDITKSMEAMDNVSLQNRQALEHVAQLYIEQNKDVISEIAQVLKARAHYKKKEQEFMAQDTTDKEKRKFSKHKFKKVLNELDRNTNDLPVVQKSA
ncbi:MAG: patatin-like phospholipase family protein [Janthinobacterium lividum]